MPDRLGVFELACKTVRSVCREVHGAWVDGREVQAARRDGADGLADREAETEVSEGTGFPSGMEDWDCAEDAVYDETPQSADFAGEPTTLWTLQALRDRLHYLSENPQAPAASTTAVESDLGVGPPRPTPSVLAVLEVLAEHRVRGDCLCGYRPTDGLDWNAHVAPLIAQRIAQK